MYLVGAHLRVRTLTGDRSPDSGQFGEATAGIRTEWPSAKVDDIRRAHLKKGRHGFSGYGAERNFRISSITRGPCSSSGVVYESRLAPGLMVYGCRAHMNGPAVTPDLDHSIQFGESTVMVPSSSFAVTSSPRWLSRR